jgi:hypothetical protein
MGKGKQPGSTEAAYEHQSAPLSSLKDPASFAPPPKRVGYPGAAGVSAGPRPADSSRTGAPAAGSALQRQQQAQEAEADGPTPGPYRADTTGLNTAHLPKPPAFRPGQASPSTATLAKPKPSLPPRLPPRQNEYPDANTPAPPPPYSETARNDEVLQGELNQGAMSRLGGAGVSVPGFGIGRASPPVPPRQPSSPSRARVLAPAPPVAEPTRRPQQNEVPSRLAGPAMPSTVAPKTGTTWAEKQAAIKTAGNLRDDPSKVTLADARSAASTANNFRQRHGEQAAAGLRTASGLNQKYGIANKVNGLASSSSSKSHRPHRAESRRSQRLRRRRRRKSLPASRLPSL